MLPILSIYDTAKASLCPYNPAFSAQRKDFKQQLFWHFLVSTFEKAPEVSGLCSNWWGNSSVLVLVSLSACHFYKAASFTWERCRMMQKGHESPIFMVIKVFDSRHLKAAWDDKINTTCMRWPSSGHKVVSLNICVKYKVAEPTRPRVSLSPLSAITRPLFSYYCPDPITATPTVVQRLVCVCICVCVFVSVFCICVIIPIVPYYPPTIVLLLSGSYYRTPHNFPPYYIHSNNWTKP